MELHSTSSTSNIYFLPFSAGKTFKYTEQGPVGLAGDKKVAVLSARGGDYSSPEANSAEMAVKYVTTCSWFLGHYKP